MVAEIMPLDFWNLFVIQVFGGFWPAVIGLMAMFFVIMMVGKVSMYSQLGFLCMFIVCMAMGYGITIVTFLVGTIVIGKAVQDFIWVIRGRQGPN